MQAQNAPELKWALRHTWQSWRERYKKNKDRLDQHIAAIVNTALSNGTLHFAPSKDKDCFRVHLSSPGTSVMGAQAVAQNSTDESNSHPQNAGSSGSQGEGWRLQEAPEPTPSWAKRKASEDDNSDDATQKRSKADNPSFRTFVLAPATTSAPSASADAPPPFQTSTEFVADFRSDAPWDQVEEEIKSIAQDLTFVTDEVRSYYARMSDLVATRQRFERIRAFINTFP